MDATKYIYRGFKGLKQAIKLEFKLKRYKKVECSTKNIGQYLANAF